MSYTRADILTPANAITALGLVVTLIGALWLNQVLGLVLVFLGRMLDLVDGPVARATRTTKFSVFFDPTADKIALLAIIAALFIYELAPLWVLLFVLVENILIAVLSAQSQRRGTATGALVPGKLNIFFQQGALFLFALAAITNSQGQSFIEVLAYICFVISLPFGLKAVTEYAQQSRTIPKATTE